MNKSSYELAVDRYNDADQRVSRILFHKQRFKKALLALFNDAEIKSEHERRVKAKGKKL